MDVREDKLIKALTELKPPKTAKWVKFQIKSLNVGDITIVDTEKGGSIIIERKTEPDLLSSFRDGRYREQKVRLLEARTDFSTKIVYLIENSTPAQRKRITSAQRKQIKGAEVKMALRDNIIIIRSENITQTANIIRAIETNFTLFFPSDSEEKDTTSSPVLINGGNIIGRKRGEAITKKTYDLTQLMNIPSVGAKTVENIMAVFNSLGELRTRINDSPDNKTAEITIWTEAKEKKRAITKTNARNLVHFLSDRP